MKMMNVESPYFKLGAQIGSFINVAVGVFIGWLIWGVIL